MGFENIAAYRCRCSTNLHGVLMSRRELTRIRYRNPFVSLTFYTPLVSLRYSCAYGDILTMKGVLYTLY